MEPENVADNRFGKVNPGGCIKINGKLREAVTDPVTKEYLFESELRALYTGGNGSIAGVFDTVNGTEDPQIVGLVSFDSLEEKEALPKIECLPLLKFPSGYSSEESPCTMICLALKKMNGQYQRVGLIGLFRMHGIVEIRKIVRIFGIIHLTIFIGTTKPGTKLRRERFPFSKHNGGMDLLYILLDFGDRAAFMTYTPVYLYAKNGMRVVDMLHDVK